MMISCQNCGHWYDDSFMNCPKCKIPQFSAEESESFYVPPPPPEISAMGEHLSHHTLTPSDSGHVNTAGFTATENGQTSDPAQTQHRSLRSVSASGTKKSKAPVIALVTVLVILVLVVSALLPNSRKAAFRLPPFTSQMDPILSLPISLFDTLFCHHILIVGSDHILT